MNNDEKRRLRIFSFDFPQPAEYNQARKTQFFRKLYGYSQQIRRRKKNGQEVTYSYYYPGILDQIHHVKLGKSVFGVVPGTEEGIVDLFSSFQEVKFYEFTGWLPQSVWSQDYDDKSPSSSSLIDRFGYLSVLIIAKLYREANLKSILLEWGFDDDYINSAFEFLQKNGLMTITDEGLSCTRTGTSIVKSLSELFEVVK